MGSKRGKKKDTSIIPDMGWKQIWNADLFCTSKKKESVFFICNSYMALRMGRGAFKASCVICKVETQDLIP